MIFTLSGIDLWSLKFLMYGPKVRWFNKRRYNFGELRKYSAADKSRNGVVGNTGTKIPIMPKTQDSVPTATKIYLNICRIRKFRAFLIQTKQAGPIFHTKIQNK